MGLQHGLTVAFFFETGIYSGLRHQNPIAGFWMLPSQRQSFLRETGLMNLTPNAASSKGKIQESGNSSITCSVNAEQQFYS
jgi:sulfur relay (sulfurtransferase) complex TusBCD TusD component (DsrE family)